MSGPLAGRTAIVTGAASGIGLGIAARLIADGAAVFVATRSKEDLERVYEHARIAGGFVGELHRLGAADDLVRTAVETLGDVDILVNNAGGGVILPTLDHTEETLRATVDNNLWTTIYCLRAKGGVHAMVTGIAREFADAGITANTVAPCYIRTPELTALLTSGVAPPGLVHVVEEATAIVPLGRPGDPAEVAAAVAFLAGEDSRFITGQTIYVNGGSSMG